MHKGAASGDPAGCIVCHNGDPNEKSDKTRAHGGEFFPDPGSPKINNKTCGQCHEDQVRVQWHSLMMSLVCDTYSDYGDEGRRIEHGGSNTEKNSSAVLKHFWDGSECHISLDAIS